MTFLFLGNLALVMWLCVTLLFGVLTLLKGNPIQLFLDPRLDEAKQTQLKIQYGYDLEPIAQYSRYLGQLARGKFGDSFLFKKPVDEVVPGRLKVSLLLGLSAYGVAGLLALFLCMALTLGRQRLKDLALGFHTLTLTTPSFVLATLLLGVFAAKLQWFPMVGSRSLFAEDLVGWPALWDRVHHAILPVLSLSLPLCGQLTAYLHAQLQALDQAGFVQSARGRGLSEFRIFWNHKLRCMLPGLIQLAGLYLPAAATGTLVIESVFGWSGMGSLLLDAVLARDLPLLLGGSLVTVFWVVVGYELATVLKGRLVRERAV